MLVYTETEANLFIDKYFTNATNKPEIKEFFIWVWNDQNYNSARMLTFSKFKK